MIRHLEETSPPKRKPMPPHPKSREQDSTAYDSYKKYQQEEAIRLNNRKVEEEKNRRIQLEKRLGSQQRSGNKYNQIMSSFNSEIDHAKSLKSGIEKAAEDQKQERINKWNDYKKGINATVTAGELTLSGGSLLGAYANWKKWKNFATLANPTLTQLRKAKIANLLQNSHNIYKK